MPPHMLRTENACVGPWRSPQCSQQTTLHTCLHCMPHRLLACILSPCLTTATCVRYFDCSFSHQAQQRELSAQIRLPPLNPKTAAPLKTLAAGLGCLFAGPVGDGGQLLQWSPNESGSTLPPGAISKDKQAVKHNAWRSKLCLC